MNSLVIIESPGKIAKIQEYLGDGYTVMSSYGHIRDLDERKLSIDVEGGFAPQYVIPADKKKVIAALRKAAESADTVYLASDEDREGEAISWHIFETLGLRKENTRRIVFHEITKPALDAALKNPRDINMDMVNAQQARRVLDRLVGFELSPVLWRKIQPKLSAGRVQSVALRLVVDREREILAHSRELFYKVEGSFKSGRYSIKASGNTRFTDPDKARAVLQEMIGGAWSVLAVEKKEATRYPSAPFTTSTLQQEASRKLHFSVRETMSVAQSLYEKGLITYMRTDSTNLSSLAVGAAKNYITETYGAEYSHPRQYRTTSKGAQEAHEAIRPTYLSHSQINGTAQEKKLYELIFKRTIASQMADAKVEKTEVSIACESSSEILYAHGNSILFDGFLKVYLEGRDDDSSSDTEEAILPDLKAGDPLKMIKLAQIARFTQPPYRYSEASLVKKMEEIGIGRPSTYGPTITTLTRERGYIQKGNKEGEKLSVVDFVLEGGKVREISRTETVGAEKGKLIPQDVGMVVTDFLVAHFSDILDYNFTARVEKDFDTIAEGLKEWKSLMAEFYAPFHEKITCTLESHEYSGVNKILGIDPETGRQVSVKYGRYGAYVQVGDGEDKACVSLDKDQMIDSMTLDEALKLFKFPRILGISPDGEQISVAKGRFGAYVKCGSVNASLSKGMNPLTLTLDEALALLKAKQNSVIADFGDIKIIDGRYGPYISAPSGNYKIPKGKEPSSLSEADCVSIIESSSEESSSKGARKRSSYRSKTAKTK